ncbi:hypothetical protein [Magnetospirillum sp. UT-4]|uniref:hypothetical protein n=1 Tax=Magnetospirillum sp. UT-4 TaxID=2681467 RepID=UPI00137E5B21|nr:hypothetical protein [Magnetospirillum sp. UT-4]CAA7622386.1 conserved hypothetical protein [Magnetospirillum sp. UT-4]
MLTWTALGRSTVKPRNDSFESAGKTVWRQNEDRLRLSRTPDGVLAAISDGAGGAGLYCGPWAERLLTRLPRVPLAGFKALNEWLDGFCMGFRSEYAALSQATPVRHAKFVREGSFATLMAGWLSSRQGRAALRWLAYGDSLMLVFDRGSGRQPALRQVYPGSLGVLDRAPHLLNWKDIPRESALFGGEVILPRHGTVILASDGIGQYLLLRALAGMGRGQADFPMAAEFARLASSDGRLGQAIRNHRARPPGQGLGAELAALRHSLRSDQTFAARMGQLHQRGLLANDDCSVILIDVDQDGDR